MTSHDGNTAWFLAQLKPNCSHIAQKNLQRQGFRTFLPLEDVTLQKRGRFVTTKRPLFPGYIFVAIATADGEWRKINATTGITKLVSFGNAPAAVPHDIVAHLMERCSDNGTLLPLTVPKPGDSVVLTQGAFASFAAEVQSIEPDRRIWVLMDIMGGQTRVRVSADQLKSV
ncbi:transcriptional antiterminator RfaH [Loktanella sp. PT4BL]|jgi:transcriptional antiterminator RfaH|uniref:transcription termination/antitermination protein NusG n=1 Tax=Loktanella sp. PT4BL TaxID=2135611 RepID=UPI000D772A9B|nr:transcriptional activator RfaH [Loktanella sp. PT4BL]PXW67927.1 transcriptional antiterminator RfaH [Loktanella sp. PT4BL]